MLIARAPVRISFAGGGTDLPAYYLEYGGIVISTTIDKYFYVFASLNGSDSVQITSSDYQTFFRHRRGQPMLWGGDLALPRAFLHEFGIDSGISLFLASEIPPGTGLGSSSTVSVALTKALGALQGMNLTSAQVAEFASRVEIEKLGMPIGRQDQYAAAFGGLNAIWFDRGGIRVQPMNLRRDIEEALERRTMLFFTGTSRSASAILKDQQAATERRDRDATRRLHQIKALALKALVLLRAGELDAFGELLHESWDAKKGLASGISNARIDECYELARAHGALGGKIAGAGGGGFLMLYCHERHQDAVSTALESAGLVRMDFRFDRGGAVILVDALPRSRRFGTEDALVPSPTLQTA